MNWLEFKISVYNKVYAPYILWPLNSYKHQLYIKKIQKKEKIVVVFYAMNLSMWNYQHLYDLLKNNSRFKIYVVISPNCTCSSEIRKKDAEQLATYFKIKGVDFFNCDEKGEVSINVRKEIDPDILFYTQPYLPVMKKDDYCMSFQDKLICYYPYAFWSANGEWSYDLDLHKIAWKLFYSTPLHLKDAKRHCNRGKNVVITGYPKTDDFIRLNHLDKWKIKDKKFKRLIWAPHFTLEPSMEGTVARSNFLMMHEAMIKIAQKYSDKIQIAFKPHPKLKNELYEHPEWGKERTELYYQKWRDMPNTFISEDEYIDLFMTSDAMVHDCSSFSIEYHYSKKPVMYVTRDINAYKEMLNDFGKIAIDLHYIGKTMLDVISFVENTVLKDNDPLKSKRIEFYDKYLIPSHGMSVAQYTYNNIVSSLGI